MWANRHSGMTFSSRRLTRAAVSSWGPRGWARAWTIPCAVISNLPGTPDRTYVVERVIDGDTLLLRGGERVRLLGVDTPETVHPRLPVQPFGPEASRYTERRVEGKAVRLGFDKERRDRYGRMLAYVYVDDSLLNEELIREGYSEAQLQYPYRSEMKRIFRAAEAEAREANRGIWSVPERDESAVRRRAG